MDRIQLTQALLTESRNTAFAQVAYFERPREYAPEASLYMREIHFLVAVGPDAHPPMSEMARRLNVTQGAVSQTVGRLEKKGYVVRTKDPADRRITLVSLTEQGRKLCLEHASYDHHQYERVSQELAEFSDEELALFIRFERVLRSLFLNNP